MNSINEKLVIGYTTGVFDLFHVGHMNILQGARSLCDYLIVGVSTDELVQQEKGITPFIPFSERISIVENIRFVDKTVSQDSYDKIAAWKILQFNRVFVGDDWKGTPRWLELEVAFKEINVGITYLPYTRSTSSTLIRDLISRSLI
jgi:glycerol-3-phosphate cytidylyltransferase